MKLTQTVKKGGCAAKIAAAELRDILSKVDFPPARPELTVGAETFDDAAVFELSPQKSLVSTLDFFTPIVDDPQLFGEIAAANALSDIFAMGGKPAFALAILAYPLATMEKAIVVQVLQGASNALRRAGASLAGGHTIDDETLKFGLSVNGFVETNRLLTNANAKPGDAIILTKALGTGTLVSALKQGIKTEADLSDAIGSMCLLNDLHACLNDQDFASIHAATDVTGFGLAGHGFQMAKASKVTIKVLASQLPKLEHATETLGLQCLTKAHRTNREYTQLALTISEGVSDIDQLLFFDPQTSGGLLLAVDPVRATELSNRLSKKFPATHIIGSVEVKAETSLILAK